MSLVCSLFVCLLVVCCVVCLELFVVEEQPVGTSIGIPLTSGRDFSFTSESEYFEIDSNTSEITTRVRLDSEQLTSSNISLQIQWHPLNPDTTVSFTSVNILILDINDNSPLFPADGETVLFLESTPVGFNSQLNQATDPDKGVNGSVSYSLATGMDEGMPLEDIPFELNLTNLPSVFLRVKSELDYETKHIYKLLLTATDGTLSSLYQIIVQVQDTNDQSPLFLSSNYSFHIPENSEDGAYLGRVEAVDTDSGLGGIVIYSVVEDNIPFSVAMDGLISVSGRIDFETNSQFFFQIKASNSIPVVPVLSPNSSSVWVSVQVTDVNDNSPYFLFREGQSVLGYSWEEEISCPTFQSLTCVTISQLSGTPNQRCLLEVGIVGDRDTGLGGEVADVLLGPLGRNYFTPIICNSLRLMTQRAVFILQHTRLDREQQLEFSFNLSLFDGGAPKLRRDWLLHLSLIDINDNHPIFSEQNYGISLAENITAGTHILTVSATDPDFGINGTVRYNITKFTPTSSQQLIVIDTRTGVISSTGPLDRETIGTEIILNVSASDTSTNPLSTLASVTILLTDVNDNAPLFGLANYFLSLSENQTVHTSIFTFLATDSDTGFAGEVRYSVEGNSIISIDPNTGTVQLESSLDYETTVSHLFTVTASDLAIPVLSTTTTLTLRVTDSNDNYPVFINSSLTSSISENASIGSSVLQISSMDADSGVNAITTYHLDTISHLFTLSETGLLLTNQTLDRERTAIYTLSVTARNTAAANQLSAAAVLSVIVTDVDDNAPKFMFIRLILNPLANQFGDILVVPSLVTDEDTNTIQCSASGQSDRFFFNSTTNSLCHLYATLPHSDGVFTLQLTAQDTQTTIQSELVVVITSLTTETINNSLVIEVSNSSQLQFLNGMYDILLTAVPVIYQLHIWSFIPSPTNQSNLWVLVSASSVELGDILTPEELSRTLDTSLPLLTPRINVTNHKVSLCVNSICVNGDCTDLIHVQSDSTYFVSNSSHLVLAAKFNLSYVCVCRSGYTGERCERKINVCLDLAPCRNMGWCVNDLTNGYVCYCQQLFAGINCETALTVCSSSPCMNAGNCVEVADTFRCECPPGYTGERCEFFIGFCVANPCMNGGKCVDSPTGFTCECSKWFVGVTCQTSILCFRSASYIQFGTSTLSNLTTSPTHRADIDFSFHMKTTQHSGQLIYLQDDNAFLLLELINSSLHYLARSRMKADSSDFVEIFPTQNVTDGSWHSVTLKSSIHSGFASLTIDGQEPLSGAQTDSLDQLGLTRQSSLATGLHLSSATVPLTVGGLSTYLPDFLSPYGNLNIDLSGPNTYANFLFRRQSLLDYTGALRNLSVNGQLVPITSTFRQVVSSFGGSGECGTDNSCSEDTSCSGNGRCVSLYTDHICVCRVGRTGRNCQISTIPVTLNGKGGISLELSNLTLESHLKSHSDWSIVRSVLYRESQLGLRQLTESESQLQVTFLGRELQPRQSLEVSFRTRSENGVILTTRDDESYAILEVSNSRLRFRLGRHISPIATHFDTSTLYSVTNASLFSLNITLTGQGLSIVTVSEEGNATHWLASTNQITWLEARAPVNLVLGGNHDSKLRTYTASSQNFSGCVSAVRVAGIELPLHQPIRELGITSQLIGEVAQKCDQYGTCQPDSCPSTTKCVPVWTGIRCECELGKEFNKRTERCEEVDECVQATTTTCHNGGQCIDGVNSFTCVCTPLYSGTICREINLTILLIILVLLVVLIALLILPFVLWLVFRLCSNSSEESSYARHKPSVVNSIPPLDTSTPNPLTGFATHRNQMWDSLKSGVKAKFSTQSHNFRSISPPLANYPPSNQVTEFITPQPNSYTAEPSFFKFSDVRNPHTFPSSNIPTRYHGNTMPPSYIPYSPPLANPIMPEHSNPDGISLRRVHISDQFV